tara:strand:- start:706 stop:996 length:291 start_codon:yes stop_codon:yes gene_type:complete
MNRLTRFDPERKRTDPVWNRGPSSFEEKMVEGLHSLGSIRTVVEERSELKIEVRRLRSRLETLEEALGIVEKRRQGGDKEDDETSEKKRQEFRVTV